MAIICKLSGHKWNGCICGRCGELRDEEHNWNGCKCNRCGKTRDEGHNWNGCKCKKCGKIRSEEHDWDGCKCRRCEMVRNEGHDFVLTGSETDDSYVHVEYKYHRCRKCGKTETQTTRLGEPQAF